MVAARPLRDVFTELTGDENAYVSDPAEVLRANGHPDLPDGLVAEAVVTFADTAPIEVAAHLSSYVAAHSPVPVAASVTDPAAESHADIVAPSWVETLASVPAAALDVAIDPTEALDPTAALDPTEALDDAGPDVDQYGAYQHAADQSGADQSGAGQSAADQGDIAFGRGLSGSEPTGFEAPDVLDGGILDGGILGGGILGGDVLDGADALDAAPPVGHDDRHSDSDAAAEGGTSTDDIGADPML